ncbi:MAG TPA: regulatory iron-sulfur-containing complex subunit RicT [Gemmatimonadales bacterium]|jgi:cell fate regulator YaaT (PSP1 superfamily)
MQTVEVRFKGNRRGFFDWGVASAPLRLNEAVLVQAERGLDFGRVNAVGAAALAKCGGCSSCETSPATGVEGRGTAVADESPTDAIPATSVAAAEHASPAEAATPDTPDEIAAPTESSAAESVPAAAPKPEGEQRPRVIRRAGPRDVAQHEELRRNEDDVRRQVTERATRQKLPMRVSDAEWQWDKNRLTIYFTAETRVDFRNLVRELATQFRTRIELRQIGVRDEAARIGGIGRCGREFCCSTWLTNTGPVNLSLAKDQHLSLNPAQISGGCGRLLCCLKYEHEFYLASRKRYPKEGKTVVTSRGPEKVIAVDIFRERVALRSDEHGSRIIAAVDLRDEMERAAAAGPPDATTPAPAPTAAPHDKKRRP